MEKGKPIIYSGVQPSGNLQLGNYIGAIRNMIALQEEYRCIYSVVDMHAITVRQDPTTLRNCCYDVLALYIASGLDPKKNIMYAQSHVPAHAELAWILDCFAYLGELSRMTQFKDKSKKNEENLNAGLFTYPVLMAADILLYQTDMVPVGDDQKQHLELCRDLAARFNNIYGDVFRVPEPYIPKVGARVMSLTDPARKMSKSDEESSYIALLDKPDVIRKKMRRAKTDTGSEVRFATDKPGISNLLSIYCAITGKSLDEAETSFEGKGYGAFKDAVADVVIAVLEPIQTEYARLRADLLYLNDTLRAGREQAAEIANRTMETVRTKVGLAPLA